MKLELGGGAAPWDGFTNMDPRHGEGEFRRRAQDGPFPLPDNSVEAARCSHLMEHIPAGQERIDVMNEMHRVLVPGGTFEVIVPLMVPGRWEPIADPTHVSFWIHESFEYFTGVKRANAEYGIRLWQEAEWTVRDDIEGRCVLRKPR